MKNMMQLYVTNVEERLVELGNVERDLEERGQGVISIMRGMQGVSHLPVDLLDGVPLGMLRRSATRLHAVCRYRRGVRKSEGVTPADVRCIDVHPYALTEEWSRYADFLLYHEYLHALGISNLSLIHI